MACTSTQCHILNNTSVMASLTCQSQHEETLPYLHRIMKSAHGVGVSHDSENSRYGRDLSGLLFIPQPCYKNMVGWFHIAFRKKDHIVTNKIKNFIVNCCMLFIRYGVLHDERAITGFVESQEWHRHYSLYPEKVKEVVLRIHISEEILNGVIG